MGLNDWLAIIVEQSCRDLIALYLLQVQAVMTQKNASTINQYICSWRELCKVNYYFSYLQ